MLYRSKNAMICKKLNDIQVRFLKKIFITWLKKEGYYADYINAKMYLNMHPCVKYSDGWPHNLNESEMYYDYKNYSNIIDQTIDYARCRDIRKDWSSINKKWRNFVHKNGPLLMSTILKRDWEK